MSIIFVCIILSVILFSSAFLKRQDKIEKQFLELGSVFNKVINKLEESEKTITSYISKYHEDIERQLSVIEKQNSESRSTLADSINNANNSLRTELGHIKERIEQVQNQYEGGEILIIEKIDKIIEQESNIEGAIKDSSKLLSSNVLDLRETSISTSNIIKEKIQSSFADQTEFIKSAITDSSSSQDTRFATVNDRITELGESLHQAGNNYEKNITGLLTQSKDGIEQQLTLLATSQVEAEKLVNENINQLKEVEHSLHNSVIERIDIVSNQGAELKNTLLSCIETKTEQIRHDYDNLLETDKSFSQSMLGQIDVLSHISSDIKELICSNIDSLLEKTTDFQDTIVKCSNEISAKVDSGLLDNLNTINAKFKETIPLISSELDSVRKNIFDIRGELLQTGSSQHQNLLAKYSELSKDSNVVLDKLGEIQKQHAELLSLINEDNEEYDKAAEAFIDGIYNQYASLNEGVKSLMAKTEIIGDRIEELKLISNNDDIVKSISSAITDLSGKINSAAIDINKKVIESHLLQNDFIKDEVLKLQILLRTLVSSPANGDTKHNRAQQINGQVEPKDLNRTESIEDAESKNIVLNQYKNNILVKSTMKNEQGTVIYELVYHNGKITQSKSYDESGTLRIEQTYYENGQVHFREEYRKDGKHSTEFDKNGHIKSIVR